MMSFYQNPTVFSQVRGDLICDRLREVLRERIALRKANTHNYKFKNMDSAQQIFDNGFQSPRGDQIDDRTAEMEDPTDRTPQSHAGVSGFKKKKGVNQVSYSMSLQNAAKNNTLNIPASNKISQKGISGLNGFSGAGAKTGDVDEHEMLDLGDDDDH